MPLYDFVCPDCGEGFEARVGIGEVPLCPACEAGHAQRVFSAFAGPFTIRPRGAAARRVEAARRTREEQRAQRRRES